MWAAGLLLARLWASSHLVVAGMGVSVAGSIPGAGFSGSRRSVRYRLKILLSARIPKNIFSLSCNFWGQDTARDPLHHLRTLPLRPLPPQAEGHRPPPQTPPQDPPRSHDPRMAPGLSQPTL